VGFGDIGQINDAGSEAGWSARRRSMYFVAAMLTILSGMFYAASRHELGSLGVTMCQYGSPFCDSPLLVLVGAGLAACWATFVSVR
jgi:hypothetical protein